MTEGRRASADDPVPGASNTRLPSRYRKGPTWSFLKPIHVIVEFSTCASVSAVCLSCWWGCSLNLKPDIPPNGLDTYTSIAGHFRDNQSETLGSFKGPIPLGRTFSGLLLQTEPLCFGITEDQLSLEVNYASALPSSRHSRTPDHTRAHPVESQALPTPQGGVPQQIYVQVPWNSASRAALKSNYSGISFIKWVPQTDILKKYIQVIVM